MFARSTASRFGPRTARALQGSSARHPSCCHLRSFATLLSDAERTQLMAKLTAKYPSPFGWEEHPDRNALTKTFLFRDFNQAWQFMSSVALRAEKMDHHPEWFNVYSTVEVTLSTHDCGGVSYKDIAMAEFMEEVSSKLLPGDSPDLGENQPTTP